MPEFPSYAVRALLSYSTVCGFGSSTVENDCERPCLFLTLSIVGLLVAFERDRLGDAVRFAVEGESLRVGPLTKGRVFSSLIGMAGRSAGAVRGIITGGEVCRDAFWCADGLR